MDKQAIIDSVTEKVKAAGLILDSVSGVDDVDVKVRVHDPHPPGTKCSVVVTAQEVAALAGKVGGEPIDPDGKKLERLIVNHVRHAVQVLADVRPVELAAARRRAAEGRP